MVNMVKAPNMVKALRYCERVPVPYLRLEPAPWGCTRPACAMCRVPCAMCHVPCAMRPACAMRLVAPGCAWLCHVPCAWLRHAPGCATCIMRLVAPRASCASCAWLCHVHHVHHAPRAFYKSAYKPVTFSKTKKKRLADIALSACFI